MYKINDYVVYRKKVCKVKEIKNKYFDNNDYYVLEPISDDSLTIEIPVDNSFIRDLITKEEVNDLIDKMKDIDIIEHNDKLIEKEYKSLLNNGTLEGLVKIIKTTYLRNKYRKDNNKKVNERDTNYLLQAEQCLYDEFSIVLNKSFDDTKKYVVDRLNKLVN